MIKKDYFRDLLRNFFYFNKSRWIIFIIIFLLFPIPITYYSSPCRLFHFPGPFQALCSVGPYPMIFSLLASIFDRYGGRINLNFLLINVLFSFITSYLLDIVYRKVRIRYRHFTR